uniref:RPA-interacting protein C-terminal domain-containing protein n=1 Tax=Strongyloides stercoralis TaxID=6248 RepID=A0A0K0DXD1_STRER
MDRKYSKSPRLTEYKSRHSGWKDDIRKEYFRKIREKRNNKFESFRNIESIQEEATENTGVDVIKNFLIENDIPQNENEFIAMQKELYEEIFLEEYEFFDKFKQQYMEYHITQCEEAMLLNKDNKTFILCPHCYNGNIVLRKVNKFTVVVSCKNCDFDHTFYNEYMCPDEDDVNELFQIATTKHQKTGCYKKAIISSIKGKNIFGKDSFLFIQCPGCQYNNKFNFEFF